MMNYKQEKLPRKSKLCAKFRIQLEHKVSKSYFVSSSTTISELKEVAEIATGIPTEIQRFHYLDRGDLKDLSTLRDLDVVSGSTFIVDIWDEWRELIEAILLKDIEQIFELGVTSDSPYFHYTTLYMSEDERRCWLKQRGFVTLFLATNRGHTELCQKLINIGIDINQRSATGRTPLHVAAATGQEQILKCLLDAGADMNMKDKNGMTPLQLAKLYGHGGCQHILVQFAFNLRAKNSRVREHPMFAHQYFDSVLKPHFSSTHAQMYVQQILPPGEFEGTSLNSPKRQLKLPGKRLE